MKCKTEKEKTKEKNAYALSIGILDRLQQEKIEWLIISMLSDGEAEN